jgi:hypothetical protein
MKYHLFILAFCLIPICVQAQKGATTMFFSYGDGKGQIKPMLAKADMSGSYTEGVIQTFNVGLVGAVSKSVAVEIGVSLLNHQYQYTEFAFPSKAFTEHRSDHRLVFPIKLRFDLLKYFFVSGGVLLSNNIGKDGGLDVGFGIGAGIQYYFKNKYGIFIYPQTNVHSPTVGLSEKHITFGLAYKII